MQFSASSLIAAAALISSAAAEFTLTVNTLGVSTVLVGPTTVVTEIAGLAVTTALENEAEAEAAIQLAIQLQAAAGTTAAASSSSTSEATTSSASVAAEETSSSATVEVHSTNAANKLGMASAVFGGLSMLYILA